MLKQSSSRRSSDDEADHEQELLDMYRKHCEQRLAVWRGTEAGTNDDTDEVTLTYLLCFS
jgi:hypothetical protein